MRTTALLAIGMVLLSGCGTIMDLSGGCREGSSRIYGGVREDVEIVFEGRCKLDALAPFFLCDLPLSAALDTALLPFTLLRALIVSGPSSEE